MTQLIVRGDTGEVVGTPRLFDPAEYVASLTAPGALAYQQQLAAAYDAACRALIGPNDVQREAGREFKEKSAWRKLQRHFHISTEVTATDKTWHEVPPGGAIFVATVTVRASAPWGQSAEAVGACATDEETGRRVITIADAIATAETRATNRAVSNLIAMGEVSAEEIGDRSRDGAHDTTHDGGRPEDRPMPFGKSKGRRLGDLSISDLESTIAWCQGKDAERFADLIGACQQVLAHRAPRGGAP
jgi:hypothetical protein